MCGIYRTILGPCSQEAQLEGLSCHGSVCNVETGGGRALAGGLGWGRWVVVPSRVDDASASRREAGFLS
jgi:hypothetical protein